jgi:hypothetical protein
MTELAVKNTVALLAELEEAGAVIDNGLFLPADLEWEKYEALGAMLGSLHHFNSFLIGDWLLYGEHTYGEKYAQAATRVGLSEQTLANYQSIANRVPPSRRRLTVSFSIHAEVASLSPNEQRHWLKVAEEEGLTKMELRERIRPQGELPPAGRSMTCPHCGGEIQL